MFSQWLENVKMLVGDESDLPPIDDLKRLFEGGRSESDALDELSGVPVEVIDE
jgi:hypothetical protein